MGKGQTRRARAAVGGHLAIARSFFEGGDYAGAIGPLLTAARLSPNDAEVLNDLGVAYMATRRLSEAIGCLRRSIASRPNVGNTHYNLGLALQHMGHDEAAIAAYRRAVSVRPDLAAAHRQLGDLLSEKAAGSQATLAYERAYAAEPSTTLGRLSKVKALSAENRDREAEQMLRELIAADASSAPAHVFLGRILQEAGRFDEAIASFERAIAIDPWQTNAYQGLVSSRFITDAHRPWIARILARLETGQWDARFAPAVSERHRMLLHFAAGKGFDDLGEYGAAIKHFQAANAIRSRLCPLDRQEIERRTNDVIGRFTKEFFSNHAALGDADETPILIVGLPRSGTTLVERIISSHPRVRGCGELTFWTEHGPLWANAEVDRLAKAAERLRTQYLGVLRDGDLETRRATDKMPFNFFWVGLVHLLFPNARIVHARRNPVDTCFSMYSTPFTANWGFVSTLKNLAWYHGQYRRLAEHWTAVIPPNRLLDVGYEDLVTEPEKTARRLIAFLGLDWDPACLRPEQNNDPVRTASSWQARQPIYLSSVERSRHYEPWVEELRALL